MHKQVCKYVGGSNVDSLWVSTRRPTGPYTYQYVSSIVFDNQSVNIYHSVHGIFKSSTFGSYQHKETYEEDILFMTVNLLKNKGFMLTKIIFRKTEYKNW